MRGWQWTVVGVVAAIVLAVGGVLVLRRSDDKRDYPTSVRDSFLVSCAAGGGATDAQCRCALERIEDDVTLTDFIVLERTLVAGQVPDEVAAAREGCGLPALELVAPTTSVTARLAPTTSTPARLASTTTAPPAAALDHTEVSPEPGRWVVDGSTACPWELLEVEGLGGGVVDSGKSAEVTVPAQVGGLRYSSHCAFHFEPGGD